MDSGHEGRSGRGGSIGQSAEIMGWSDCASPSAALNGENCPRRSLGPNIFDSLNYKFVERRPPRQKCPKDVAA